MVTKNILRKARRHIRKAISTGEHQPRTYPLDGDRYEYKVKHGALSIYFQMRNNRLMLQK